MRKIKNIALTQLITLFLVATPLNFVAYAATSTQDGGSSSTADSTTASPVTSKDCPSHQVKVDSNNNTSCVPVIGNGCANDAQTPAGQDKCLANNPVIKYLKIAINSLSAGVGIIVIAMIILGGIQYSASRDNATAVSEAKKRITNAIIAMVLYMLIFAFLQWLIPGGVFGP